MESKFRSPRLRLMAAMLIFGTVGIFRKFIPLSSSMLAMLRGFIGVAFLWLVITLKGERLDVSIIRANWKWLTVSGIFIGLNWIALFEAYRYTSVAVATLCYYMAPAMVILASPLVLKEKLVPKKAVCVLAAVMGMVFVSGVMEEQQAQSLKGIGLGLGAACLYASVILMNKKMPPMACYDKTMVQLFAAAAVLLPYNLVQAEMVAVTVSEALLVAVVGIVHTGIAYALYFSAMDGLKAQIVALYSYIDPVSAIVLSLIIFREKMTAFGILGTVLILGATLVSDLMEEDKTP